MSSRRLVQIGLALFFVSLVYLLAALQIPHIGEGAPDWHTVRRPQIPVEFPSAERSPPPQPASSGSSDEWQTHAPIALLVGMRVSILEPVKIKKYDPERKQWVDCWVKRAVCKYVQKWVIAYWIDTMNCYGFFDDYGRLRLLPDVRLIESYSITQKGG